MISPKIEVFAPDLEPLGWLDQFTSLQWVEKPTTSGWIEIWCPLNESNSTLLKEGNVIWLGEETATVVESVKSDVTERGMQVQVRGKSLESYIGRRINWGQYIKNDTPSNIMRDLVDLNCINPTIIERKLPFLHLKDAQTVYGDKLQYQNTGGNLEELLQAISETHNLGWEVLFDPFSKRLDFSVFQGINRTINQTEVDAVIFDSDMEDLLASSYFYNISSHRNVAYVAGAGEGANRKFIIVNDAEGLNRRELYVDARDLQPQDANMNPIPNKDYEEMLLQRGLQKLSEWEIVETFTADIRSQGTQYIYGQDYKKGDWVTMQDRRLNVMIDAKVTEVQKIFNDKGYSLNITFGYTQPTINALIRAIAK